MHPAISFLKELIACPSITPNDADCQKLISNKLKSLGFQCEDMPFGEVSNLWATFGSGAPLLVFAGHTDVVPTGPLTDWQTPPFTPDIRDDAIYGRGTCDMKGALAAMVVAVEAFLKNKPQFDGTLAFLLTSDEEGPALDGTQKVIAELTRRGIGIQYCIVGEPSSQQTTGDQIRVGRRGSLHGKLIIHGKQGHVAHPHLAINPIHQSMLALDELVKTKWDDGNNDFPPTTFQITNIHAGTGAANVIPGHLETLFNFRFSTAVTIAELKTRTESILQKQGLSFDITWTVGAEPFLSKKGRLITAVTEVIQALTRMQVKLSTGGGTSDGRFIAPTGAELIELGVTHATAHHVNEHVPVKDIETLAQLYQQILIKLFPVK